MGFWCRIRHSKLQLLSHQCQRLYSQIHGVSSSAYSTVGGTIPRVSEKHSSLLTCRRPNDLYTTVRFFAAPVQAKPKPEKKDSKGPRLNQQITADIVRLVSDEGHEVVSRREALERAKEMKLDLVEVQRDAKPPVCKIMDFHREKYKKQTEQKDRVKSKLEIRRGDCKEIRFTTKIDEKDLQMKADTVKRLMEKGYRVKVMATGKEDQDLGGLLSRLSAKIEDVAIVESGPMVERLQAYAIVRHVKFGPSKKGAAKKFTAPTKADVPEAATSSPIMDTSCSTHNPQPIEDDWEPMDSCSESEDDIIPEQTGTPSKSLTKVIDGKLEKSKMVWSAFGASDDVEAVFDFGGNKSGGGKGVLPTRSPEKVYVDPRNERAEFPLMQNRVPNNPQGSTGSARTGLQFPNQCSQPREPLNAGRSTERIYTDSPKYPPVQSHHADSPQGSTGSVRERLQYSDRGRQPREPLNARTPLVHNRHPSSPQGSTGSVRVGTQFPNQGRQPQEPMHAGIPSGEQKQTRDDSSTLRNLRQHLINNTRKQESPHMVSTPTSPTSSYGIFSSLPKPTVPSKQSTNTEVNSSDTKRNLSANPAESRQRPEAGEASREAWGIFSKESSNGKQNNFDSQANVKR